MEHTEQVELKIEIKAPEATNEQLDRMTRQLLTELHDLRIGQIGILQAGSIPEGTKSAEAITLGAIAIAVLPSLLPKLIEAVQAWALRGNNRIVKFKGKISKQMIEFEGSAEEFQKLLSTLSKKGK